ncbi:hypothetical protein [Erysipelothrix urinaevulpis]|nr:hypothetical protein [Erysipelothrix urinaevulpis]
MTIIISIAVGYILYKVYTSLFQIKVRRALAGEKIYPMADLEDLVVVYISFTLIILLFIAVNDAKRFFRNDVGSCLWKEVEVEGISDHYSMCTNRYGNVIFKNQEEVLDVILNDHQALILNIQQSSLPISSNEVDNLYYLLTKDHETDEKRELYLLLTIYRNYYIQFKDVQASEEVIIR